MAGRRTILRLGAFGAFAVLVMARPWTALRQPGLSFDPIGGMAPFRVFSGAGTVSGGRAVDPMLVGLAPPSRTEADRALEARLRATACARLIGDWRADGPVPVSYFTDLRCVNCLALERNLAPLLEVEDPAVRLTTREFPVFGPVSELAARAVLAAGQQDAAEAMRARLKRSAPASSEDAMGDHASGLGLDPGRFARDLAGPEIAGRLAEDSALARILGVPGTPALLIGRSLIVGVQPTSVLEMLIANEAAEGPPTCA